MNKRQSWNVATLFLVMIFGFTIATFLKPDTTYSETENRTLQQMPELTLQSLLDGSFESDYETYLTDQFVLRDNWIGLKTQVERAAFATESKDIYFADDGYLIEKHTGSFTSDAASGNIALLQQFVQKYAGSFESGRLTVMIVPNAVDILRDLLPAFASPYDEETYLQSVEAALPEGVWFGVSEVLTAHKDEELYYRTDHHWKTLAAFYTWQAWAEKQGYTVPQASDYEITAVTDSFEGTIQSKLGIHGRMDSIELWLDPSDPFYTVQKDSSTEVGYSLYDYPALETKSKYDIFLGGNNALTKITTREDTGRRILVIKDSYAHCFIPFLLNEFDEIDVLDIRYYNQKISDLMEEGAYTDLLFLYNASGFAEDTSLAKLLY